MTAVHAAESRLVLGQDAEVTAKLMANLGPVLVSLQGTREAVLRVGALLIVKQDDVVTVRQLSAAQQLMLNHNPMLETSPRAVVQALQPSAQVDGPHLDLTGDPAPEFPVIREPSDYVSACIWDCAYESLAPVQALVTLTRLEIGGYPDPTLAPLSELTRLEHLSILHLPQVTDLAPLAALVHLRKLELMCSPGVVTEVVSLTPLRSLPNLVELTLLGVRSPDQRVDDLLDCPSLRVARLSGYPKAEVDRLDKALSRR